MTSPVSQPQYRWVIVTAAALILAISMGAIVNGMSAFIVPMQMQFGWPRGQIALINFAGIMGLAFGGLLMGPLARRQTIKEATVANGADRTTCTHSCGES